MTITIDKQQAIDLLNKAVKINGEDYIYPGAKTISCYYAKDGAPSCIVGYAISNLSADLFSKLAAYENNEGPSEMGEMYKSFLKGEGVEMTDEALAIWKAAQTEQDMGARWGSAVSFAIEYPQYPEPEDHDYYY